MATTTTNLGLTKPAVSDAADISVLNVNFDKIDVLGGYGLGNKPRHIDPAHKLSQYTASGFYYWSGSNTDPDKPFGAGEMLVVKRATDGYVNQIAFSSDHSTPYIKVRKQLDSSWSEWDWLNPPMALGVEYRTTERYIGMPVYVKMIDFGALPYGTRKNVAHGITGMSYKVRSEISCTGTGQLLQYNPAITEVIVNDTGVYITTNSDMSIYSVYFTVWYTK